MTNTIAGQWRIKEGFNVLSYFDGMSCGQSALKSVGKKVTNYFAAEIEKPSIKIALKNFPNTKQLGDVTKVDLRLLPKIHLFIGGSPCQGFSFAGKQLNFNDPRSRLFFEFAADFRFIQEFINPDVKFLLENVKMKKEYLEVISRFMGVEHKEINSSSVTAQNRKRYYWTNIENVPDIEESNLMLSDILEKEVSNDPLPGYDHLALKYDQSEDFKAGSNRLDYLKSKLYDNARNKGITYLAAEIINDTPSKISRQIDRIYCISAKGPCLTKFDNRIKICDPKTKNVRYLTINEYEALQTVEKNYTEGVPENKRREMLGNGWTVKVIAHFFKYLP